MILLSLELRGIGSYSSKKPVTIDFGERTLFLGPNGTGKSWIAEAIALCLFGRTIRSIDAYDVVHRAEGVGTAILTFVAGVHKYRVTLVRDRSKRTVSYLFERQMEGEWENVVPGGRRDEVLDAIQQAIGVDWWTFRQSAFFGQNDVSVFLNGTDQQRRELLSSMMRLERYHKALLAVRKKIGELRTELAHANGQVETLEQLLKGLEQDERTANDVEAKKQELEQLKLEIEERKKRQHSLSRTMAKYENIMVDESQLLRARRRLESLIANQISAIKRGKTNLENAAMLRDDFQKRYIEPIKILEYAKAVIENVPNYDPSWVARKEETENYISILDLDSLEWPKVASIEQDIQNKEAELQTLQHELSLVNSELNSLPSPDNYEKLKAELYEMDQNIYNMEVRYHEIMERLSQLDAISEQRQNIIEKLQVAKSVQNQLETELKVLNYLEDAFNPKGVPSLILYNILGPLNHLTNQYLMELGQTFGVQVQFAKERESGASSSELRVIALIGEREVELGCLSGGERQRVELALRFALSQLNPMAGQVLILDEVTTGIDEIGLHHLSNLLKNLDRQVIAISHEEILAESFDRVIRLKKVDGATVLEEEH